MMERFRKSLEMAALAVQASLKDVVIEFDGKRHYLPNNDGERDQRQYYVASLERHKDGTLWPEITFGSFKASVENQYWLPRNIAWEQFEVERRGGRVVQDSECLRQYKEAIAEQVKRALVRYALKVVRIDIDPERNPFGLVLDCYARAPERIETPPPPAPAGKPASPGANLQGDTP